MQRFILVAILSLFPLLPCWGSDVPNAGDDQADISQVGMPTSDPSLQYPDDSAVIGEHDDHLSEDAVAAVMAERDDLRAQFAQKNKEYVAQYRAAQKMRSLFQQEQKKNARLTTLLKKALSKLRTFHQDFDNLAKVRSMLDSAVDTAASLSLEGAGEDPGLDSEIEDAMAMVKPARVAATTASQRNGAAPKKNLRHKGSRGKRHRTEKTKAADQTMAIPDVEGNSIAAGHADPDRDATARDAAEGLKLDSDMAEEDEQIQLLEQAAND